MTDTIDLYRVALEHIDEVVYSLRAEPGQSASGVVQFVSAQVQAILGYEPHEFIADASLWFRLLHPDDVDSVVESTRRIFSERRGATRTYRLKHRTTGEYRWFEDKVVPQFGDRGEMIGHFGVARDVTERVLALEAVRASANDYRELLESSPDGVIAVSTDGRIVFANAQIERMFGYTRDEIIGQVVEILLPEQFRDAHVVFRASYAREPYARPMGVGLNLVGRRKDGSNVPVEVSLSHVSSSGQSFVRANVRDLSEKRRLEEQLRQAQKMEAVGRLAGGIAHDFNNLLTVISGSVDLAVVRLPDDNPIRDDLDAIRHAARRATDLTRQLLAFSRRQIIAPRTISLNEAVRGAGVMLTRLLRGDILLVTKLEPSLWPVKADPGQIEQVIINLAVNARDAMPRGGTLTIETRNVELDTSAVAAAAMKPGPYTVLEISDTGVGIDREIMGNLFEPFFTTKGPTEGTGLGLATVYGIVQQSGGDIRVGSEVGRGTTFTIYLPRVDEPLDSRERQSPQGSLQGTETVLVVEDERGIQELVRRVLEHHGYTVLVASDGRSAIDLARHYAGPIDLLVTDIVIPEMSGRAVAETISSFRPGVKVLYISGYSSNVIARQGVLEPGVALLEKPFATAELASRVRDVLDRRG